MENKQRVIIDEKGSLRVESDKGLYAGGLHSCVLAGDFMIDSKSVANLILQQDSKGGFRRVYDKELGGYCYVRISSEEIVEALEKKEEKILELNDRLCTMQEEKNRLKWESEDWKGCYERLKNRVENHNKKWYSK
jgi:hypothetical protein